MTAPSNGVPCIEIPLGTSTELTPYAKLVVERLLQTWVEVDFEKYYSDENTWAYRSVTDTDNAKQARERYAELYGEPPPTAIIQASQNMMNEL